MCGSGHAVNMIINLFVHTRPHGVAIMQANMLQTVLAAHVRGHVCKHLKGGDWLTDWWQVEYLYSRAAHKAQPEGGENL